MSDELCINTIRTFCADVVQNANSGHPGAPMGMAVMAHTVWTHHLRLSPTNPKWSNRDRFVLSNGHASALLYTLLHLSGYSDWDMKTLKTFRQLESIAAGHPECHFQGIEVTTGPLGQGLSNAVGLAIGEAHLASVYNKEGFPIVDHYTYVFCGDGCLQEGVTSEASSLAGHLGLGKLIVLYDDNKITIDGATDLSFTEDVIKRYESYGWHTQVVSDGNSVSSVQDINKAIEEAKKVKDKPSFIKVSTIIAYGSKLQGTHHAHGSPLGNEDIEQVKKKFGFDPAQKFYIPEDVYKVYNKTESGKKHESEWNKLFQSYSEKYPELSKQFKRTMSGELPDGWEKVLPSYKPEDPGKATRELSGVCINKLAAVFPELIGGSADLNPSTKTYINSDKDLAVGQYQNRNIRFGVREHAMAAICNGLACYGGLIPYCSTFLNFIGYAYGAVILTCLSELRVLYVFTHDSIFLGEDGPTHQPIEKYAVCRSTPNLNFWRPADGNETSASYISAIKQKGTPTVFSFSRQTLPNLKGSSIEGALKGGYILADAEGGKPEVVLVGTGSETQLTLGAREKLPNARAVSLPCWEEFDKQPLEYRKSVFPDGVPVVSIEAATTCGWAKYAHASVGIDRFGSSGKDKDLAKFFGMTVDNLVDKANKTLAFYKGKHVPNLLDRPFIEEIKHE